MSFAITFSSVAVMLLYSLPGFLIVKTGTVKSESIPNFSKVLLYICQPCLIVYSLLNISYTPETGLKLLLCFALALGIMTAVILLIFLLLGKRRKEILWRIVNLAAVMSNCGFLGVPLLEKLLPDHPEALAYSCVFSVAMNMIGWSLGLFIISLDRKYISVKKILLNPCTLSLAAALPFFLLNVDIPGAILDAITLVGRMSTPMCMIIMGMRLATVRMKDLFLDLRQYLAVALGQLVYPLAVFGILFFVPVDPYLKKSVVIMCACPVASMVQNYAELLGQGQDKAANMVLLGTVYSVVTVPLICLLL